jgi:hypothetical protein
VRSVVSLKFNKKQGVQKMESTGFDIATAGADIVSQLGTAQTAIAAVLGAAILITVAIVVYRKFSGGVNRA